MYVITQYFTVAHSCHSEFFLSRYYEIATVKLSYYSTSESDPRPVCGARRLSGARLLL